MFKNGWTASTPAASKILFDTKIRNTGGLNGIFVKRRDSPLTYETIGPARQHREDLFDIVMFAKQGDIDNVLGNTASDQLWKMLEQVKSIVCANPQLNVANGIEWQWLENYTVLPATDAFAQTVLGQADTKGIKVGIARLKAQYDMTSVASSSPSSPSAPARKDLVLSRTSAPFSENPAKSLLDYLYNNYSAASPIAKGSTQTSGQVVFLLNYGNFAQSLNQVYVKPYTEVYEEQTGANPRLHVQATYKIDVFTKNTVALARRWSIEEEIERIILSDVGALQSKGIDEVYLVDLETNELDSTDDLAQGKATASLFAFSTFKVRLDYTYEAQ
jgi:hypothetical protein